MIRRFFRSTIRQTQAPGGGTVQFATFDGSNDYIAIPTLTASFADGFTIEGWFRFGSTIDPFTGLFELGSSTETAYLRLITLDDNPEKAIQFAVTSSDGSSSGRGANSYILTDWHYYGIVVSNEFNNVKFYRDDILMNTETISNLTIKEATRDQNRIGMTNGSSRRMPMDARGFKIWNKERTIEEISLKGEGVGPQTGLLIDYPLSTDTNDVSGNNLHGTAFGGLTFNEE